MLSTNDAAPSAKQVVDRFKAVLVPDPDSRFVTDGGDPRQMKKLPWVSCADLSRLTSTYRECLDLFREALAFLSTEDKDWILGKAPADVFRWPEAPVPAK